MVFLGRFFVAIGIVDWPFFSSSDFTCFVCLFVWKVYWRLILLWGHSMCTCFPCCRCCINLWTTVTHRCLKTWKDRKLSTSLWPIFASMCRTRSRSWPTHAWGMENSAPKLSERQMRMVRLFVLYVSIYLQAFKATRNSFKGLLRWKQKSICFLKIPKP